jgi:hypothetical protein
VILNNATNLELADSVSNWFFLVFGLPEEAWHLDSEDLLSEYVKIGLGLVWLDLEEDEGFSNNNLLGSVGNLGLGCCDCCFDGL